MASLNFPTGASDGATYDFTDDQGNTLSYVYVSDKQAWYVKAPAGQGNNAVEEANKDGIDYVRNNGGWLKADYFSGDYSDLANTPNIPTDNSELTNGAGYITSAEVPDVNLDGYATQSWVNSQGFAKGSIPTDNSQIGNGRNYITNNISGSFTCSDNIYTGDAIVFTSQSNGALLHSPESSGGLLRWRLAAPETKVFFRNYKTSSWVEVANASDPKLKNIKTDAVKADSGPSIIDQLNIIDFEWDEDELRRANLYVNHIPGQSYVGFDANQIEELMPGTTLLNDYLPGNDETSVDDQYRSIEKEGLLSLVANLVREVQELKAKIQ